MPFRTYDQKGKFKTLLNLLCWTVSWVPKINVRGGFKIRKRNLKPWELKEDILSTYMELLRMSVVVISIAVLATPSYYIIKYFLKGDKHTPHMEVLSSIELLLMLLTFILFALGLVVLFEPAYARGLPKWMLSFTRIATLEGTILRLVVIILAIHVLGRFLLSDNQNTVYTPIELFMISVSICLITLAIGTFTKYFLRDHENADSEDV